MQIDTGSLTAGAVITLWGILQSFGLEYLWFVKDWFDKLDVRKKQTVNAAGVFLITAIAYGLSVAGIINAFTPDLEGLLAAFIVFFTSLGVAQGVHRATKKPTPVP